MKTKPVVFISFLVTAVSAQAATGFFGGLYFITSLNGGTNIRYQVTTGSTPGFGAQQGHDLTSDGSNPQFASFGTLNISDSLVLKGFEYKTYQNDFSDVTHANLFYRIYQSGSPSGDFTQISTTSPFAVSGGDETWQVTNGTTNLLKDLTPGDYTIQIYTESYTNGVNTAGNIFGFTAEDNPTATFTVIPEPSTALLGALGMLALLRRRRS